MLPPVRSHNGGLCSTSSEHFSIKQLPQSEHADQTGEM
ncbi:hypothetical protein PspLS_08989 [Pyricularia sp. CBS 133598]|nr:hypothetical protein PspLS_08989 [Pyricularia sp. CBS 133598]